MFSLANIWTSMPEMLRKCHLNKDETEQTYHYLEKKKNSLSQLYFLNLKP